MVYIIDFEQGVGLDNMTMLNNITEPIFSF